MASRCNEIKASVNAVVDHATTVHSVFLLQVGIESRLDAVENRLPALLRDQSSTHVTALHTHCVILPLFVVNKVAETRSVYNCQSKLYAVLFNVGCDGLNFDSLRRFVRKLDILFGRIQGSIEKCVHQGRFTQTRFTCLKHVYQMDRSPS